MDRPLPLLLLCLPTLVVLGSACDDTTDALQEIVGDCRYQTFACAPGFECVEAEGSWRCRPDPDAGIGAPACVEGRSLACECADGVLGAALCGDDGRYGPCDCQDDPPLADGGGADTGADAGVERDIGAPDVRPADSGPGQGCPAPDPAAPEVCNGCDDDGDGVADTLAEGANLVLDRPDGTTRHLVLAGDALALLTSASNLWLTLVDVAACSEPVRVQIAQGGSGPAMLAWNGDGFGVTWRQWEPPPSATYVTMFQRLTSGGVPVGDPIRLDGAKPFGIAWTGDAYAVLYGDGFPRPDQPQQLRATLIDADGNTGEPRVLAESTLSMAVTAVWGGDALALALQHRPVVEEGEPAPEMRWTIHRLAPSLESEASAELGAERSVGAVHLSVAGDAWMAGWIEPAGLGRYAAHLARFEPSLNPAGLSSVEVRTSFDKPVVRYDGWPALAASGCEARLLLRETSTDQYPEGRMHEVVFLPNDAAFVRQRPELRLERPGAAIFRDAPGFLRVWWNEAGYELALDPPDCVPDGRECWPLPERCNGADDDCDSETDEGFDLGAACEVGVGACARPGIRACGEDGEVECSGEPGRPAAERCSGLDDDCDGETDEDFDVGADCSVGVGACEAPGARACTPEGEATVCEGEPGAPVPESCNDVDDDCDGRTDEDFPTGELCREGLGICAAVGVTRCDPRGDRVECNAAAREPEEEVCNGADDDCDGEIDDGFGTGEPCTVGEGDCTSEGRIVCSVDELGPVCDARPREAAPEECNGVDDDCDALTDEGCPCVGPGDCAEGLVCNMGECAERECWDADDCGEWDCFDGICFRPPVCNGGEVGPCGSDVGACEFGEAFCRFDGTWGSCNGDVGPRYERCNGLDDDCDGATDEGPSWSDRGTVCSVGRRAAPRARQRPGPRLRRRDGRVHPRGQRPGRHPGSRWRHRRSPAGRRRRGRVL